MINEEITDGLPSSSRQLKAGDVLKIGFVLILKGYCVQSNISQPIGFEPVDTRICKAAEEACSAGVLQDIFKCFRLPNGVVKNQAVAQV